VGNALSAIGSRWDPLIFEVALFEGLTRFSEFQERLEISASDLNARLEHFVTAGLMEIRHQSTHQAKNRIGLTKKGLELAPAMIALAIWGDRWTPPDGPASDFEHFGCGGTLRQFIRCDGCEEVPELDEVRTKSRAPIGDPTTLPVSLTDGDVDSAEVPDPVMIEIFLMGTFSICIGDEPIDTPSIGTQRILAYLALHDRPVSRLSMAGTMWPEVSDFNASGSLRSALSRLDGEARQAIHRAAGGLRLANFVNVDLRKSRALARRLVRKDAPPDEGDLGSAALAALSTELLPDWYDDWVLTEAEDWRQLRTSGLEALAGWLTIAGRYAEAAGAARAAMKAEPLRESAHACLVRVHLAEGNQSEAFRALDQFESLLNREMGLFPTKHLSKLFEGLSRT
jgi:DNA-binding SARP family transcriptional activator/DNA-binding HxlR family transcriptional regulator